MNALLIFFQMLFFLTQDSSMRVDTTAAGYKIGVYLGGSLPFIALLIVFLLIIRSRYRFKSKEKD